MEVQTILNISFTTSGVAGWWSVPAPELRAGVPVFPQFSDGASHTPLGDTVTFVYCDHGDFHRFQFGAENLRIHTFRRNIEEFVITEDTILQCGENLLARHAGIRQAP